MLRFVQTLALLSLSISCQTWSAEAPDSAAVSTSAPSATEQPTADREDAAAKTAATEPPVTQQQLPIRPGKKLTVRQKRIFVLGLEDHSTR